MPEKKDFFPGPKNFFRVLLDSSLARKAKTFWHPYYTPRQANEILWLQPQKNLQHLHWKKWLCACHIRAIKRGTLCPHGYLPNTSFHTLYDEPLSASISICISRDVLRWVVWGELISNNSEGYFENISTIMFCQGTRFESTIEHYCTQNKMFIILGTDWNKLECFNTKFSDFMGL